MTKIVEVNPARSAGPGYLADRRMPLAANYMDRDPEISHSSTDPLTGTTVSDQYRVIRQTSFDPVKSHGGS